VVAVPAVLLACAYGAEHIGGLPPCEMCWWQRWAHMAALAFGLASLLPLADRGRSMVWLAALAMMASGLIGAWHAGIEAGLVEGFTQCSTTPSAENADDLLNQIMAAPIVRCDQAPWSFLGISMAGWNALLSIAAAVAALWLALRRRNRAQ